MTERTPLTLDDKIALEIGHAHWRRIKAEVQLEAQAAEIAAVKAELQEATRLAQAAKPKPRRRTKAE